MTIQEYITAMENEYLYALNSISVLERQNLEPWEKIALIESECKTARAKHTKLYEQLVAEKEG